MKEKYRTYATIILTTIFFVQLTQSTSAQESLSADTPFIEVNGKTIKFGSAIIAFSKIRQFARKDPVAALAGYDLGKGILGKIMKARVPNVPTPRAIRVSAKS